MDKNELVIIYTDEAITDLDVVERNNAGEIAKMFHKGCQALRCCGVESNNDLVGMRAGLMLDILNHLFMDLPRGLDYNGYDEDIDLISSL